MAELVKLNKNVYAFRLGAGDSLVSFEPTYTDLGFGEGNSYLIDYVPLGKQDEQLQKMHKLACSSPNKWRLIETRRDFLVGAGVKVKTAIEENGNPVRRYVSDPDTKTIEAWLMGVDFDTLFVDMAMQLAFSGRFFLLLKLDLHGKPVGLELVDVFHCRPKRMKAGERGIRAYLLNSAFGSKHYKKENSFEIPAFDWTNPTKYPVSILDVRHRMPGQVYHPFASWWGTERWTELANMIPEFHKSGLLNGYNIKYHIRVPDDYFAKEGLTEEEEEKLKVQVLTEMSESFEGLKGTDKTIYTFDRVAPDGKTIIGVQVIPIENKMSDDAYTQLFRTAVEAETAGHGVQPILAGVNTGSKLGGSGKEMEAAANYTQGFMTYADRKLLLKPLEVIRALMGWPADKVFEVENIQLYTYDSTPTKADSNPN